LPEIKTVRLAENPLVPLISGKIDMGMSVLPSISGKGRSITVKETILFLIMVAVVFLMTNKKPEVQIQVVKEPQIVIKEVVKEVEKPVIKIVEKPVIKYVNRPVSVRNRGCPESRPAQRAMLPAQHAMVPAPRMTAPRGFMDCGHDNFMCDPPAVFMQRRYLR
jgi:hypothetical protein